MRHAGLAGAIQPGAPRAPAYTRAMTNRMARTARIAAPLVGGLTLALSLATLTACGSGSGATADAERPDPGIVASNREANPITREKAIRAGLAMAQAGEIDRAAWREQTKSIAWLASNPARTRTVALEALLADDPEDTRAMVALMLPKEPAWPVIGWICDTAAARGWTDLTPSLVRSWSRPVVDPKDEDRPERAALAALHPHESLEEVVFEVFATPAGEGLLEQRRRTDAWALLTRIDLSLTRTRAMLGTLAPRDNDPLIGALSAAATDLRAVPQTAEQLEWLASMREHEDFWNECREAIASLDPEQLDRFELRHASAVRWAARRRPQWLAASRAELLSELRDRLSTRRVFQRYSGYAEGQAPEERYERNADRLSWGDALLLLIADEAIHDRDVLAALFEQADADRRDTSTEYGGVLDASGEGFAATLHPPRPAQRVGDNRFVASPELMAEGVTALFHYHFHASRGSMRDYAGPGEGDDAYARTLGRSCIVFTALAGDSLNADYYQPDGAVIDLGEVRRP